MQTTLNVKGMSCGHCVSSVKGALEQVKGIENVDIDLAAGKVDVTYDDAQVTVDDLKNTIENQGYDVV